MVLCLLIADKDPVRAGHKEPDPEPHGHGHAGERPNIAPGLTQRPPVHKPGPTSFTFNAVTLLLA